MNIKNIRSEQSFELYIELNIGIFLLVTIISKMCSFCHCNVSYLYTKINLLQPRRVFSPWQPSWVKTCHPVVTRLDFCRGAGPAALWLISVLGSGAGELHWLLLTGEQVLLSTSPWEHLKNADVFVCFSGGWRDIFCDAHYLHCWDCVCVCVCVCVCALGWNSIMNNPESRGEL